MRLRIWEVWIVLSVNRNVCRSPPSFSPEYTGNLLENFVLTPHRCTDYRLSLLEGNRLHQDCFLLHVHKQYQIASLITNLVLRA